MGNIDAAVRGTVVRAVNISTLLENPQQDSFESFHCQHCGRPQFIKSGRQRCIACQAKLPAQIAQRAGRQPAPMNLNLPMGCWICKRLESVRILKGLTQRGLAAMIPCPRTYVSKYENFHCVPTLAMLERLAWVLQVDMRQLIDRTVPLSELGSRLLDAGNLASHEAMLAELETLLPRLDAAARRNLLNIARTLVNGQQPFYEWMNAC